MTRLTYQIYDATRMQNLLHKGPAQAKVAWGCSNLENSSTVWSWRIHVFTNLYASVESNPKMKKNAMVMMRILSISRANPWEDLTHHHWLVGAGNNGLDSRKYLLILIKAGHRQKTNGYQDLHSDQSETDYRFEVLSKGNCGQSSCAAKHRPTDQNRVLEKTARCCR